MAIVNLCQAFGTLVKKAGEQPKSKSAKNGAKSGLRKWLRVWLKKRDWIGTVLVSRVLRLRRSRLRARTPPLLNLKKKRDCSGSAGREKKRACKTPQSAHYVEHFYETVCLVEMVLKWRQQNVQCRKISQARHVCLNLRMHTCWRKPSKLTNHSANQEPINRITDILDTLPLTFLNC